MKNKPDTDVESLSPPIDTRSEFRRLARLLADFLGALSPADWQRPTVSSRWCVKDLAAHLVDGSLRRVSLMRDGYREFYLNENRAAGFASLFDYLDQLNREWVAAAARLSPGVLLEMLRTYDAAFCDLMDAADLDAPAVFPVAWAGESQSRNWMDFGREYTEKWYHQQQIRLAFDDHAIEAPEYLHPVYRLFMRAVPFHLRAVGDPEVASVSIRITGPGGGNWDFTRGPAGWERSRPLARADAVFHFDSSWAWRFFCNRKFKDEMRERVDYCGPAVAENAILDMLTMMA